MTDSLAKKKHSRVVKFFKIVIGIVLVIAALEGVHRLGLSVSQRPYMEATAFDIFDSMHPHYTGKNASPAIRQTLQRYSTISRAIRINDSAALSSQPAVEVRAVSEETHHNPRAVSVSVSPSVVGWDPDQKDMLLIRLDVSSILRPTATDQQSDQTTQPTIKKTTEWHGLVLHKPRQSTQSSTVAAGSADSSFTVTRDITVDPYMLGETYSAPRYRPLPFWDLLGQIFGPPTPDTTLSSD